MATLPTSWRCLISRGTEDKALENPDVIRERGAGFCTDTNCLLFFYKEQLCRVQGVDVGPRPKELDLGEVGHLKNDNSITIVGTDKLWSFKGYMNVFAGSPSKFIFVPFDDVFYDVIVT